MMTHQCLMGGCPNPGTVAAIWMVTHWPWSGDKAMSSLWMCEDHAKTVHIDNVTIDGATMSIKAKESTAAADAYIRSIPESEMESFEFGSTADRWGGSFNPDDLK